jgi:hypothetical protein
MIQAQDRVPHLGEPAMYCQLGIFVLSADFAPAPRAGVRLLNIT